MFQLDQIDLRRLLLLEADLSQASLEDFLQQLKAHYGLTNLVYHCPSFPGRTLTDPFLALTYSEEWVEHYKAQNYVAIDPVFNLGARAVTPIDWGRLPKVGKKTKRLFHESIDAGVGRQGVTIPVRGPGNGTWALFSATTDDNDLDWEKRRYFLIRDLVHVAHFVHQRAFDLNVVSPKLPDLNAITRREIEALRWSAEGKTTEDIGTILGVSVETAKAHLDAVRFKLQALNRVHAVAKAIRAGLIS